MEIFRLFKWMPLNIDDDIANVEDKIEKGTFVSIPLTFGNVIDFAIFVFKLVNYNLKPVNTNGTDYTNEWTRID